MKLIDINLFNRMELLGLDYSEDFVAPRFYPQFFDHVDDFVQIREFFHTSKGFEPKVLPVVVRSTFGVLQQVLPLRGYRKNGVLFIMWGGFSNKDHWVEVDKANYEVDVVDNQSVAIVGDYAVALVTEPESRDTKDMVKADKLSALALGNYKLESVKAIETKFGPKFIACIGDKEFWANKQLEGFIQMLGCANMGGMTLKVLSKGTTASGHPTVKVGLVK